MGIASCKRCKGLFNKKIKDICSNCVLEEEESYKKVRLYLKRHNGADMIQVSRETDVGIELIIQFLQDGRISFGEGVTVSYPCKECDRPIHTGSLCVDCKNEANNIQKSLVAFAGTKKQESVVDKKHKKTAFYTRD